METLSGVPMQSSSTLPSSTSMLNSMSPSEEHGSGVGAHGILMSSTVLPGPHTPGAIQDESLRDNNNMMSFHNADDGRGDTGPGGLTMGAAGEHDDEEGNGTRVAGADGGDMDGTGGKQVGSRPAKRPRDQQQQVLRDTSVSIVGRTCGRCGSSRSSVRGPVLLVHLRHY